MPPKIYPKMAGCPSRRARAAPNNATNKTSPSSLKNCMSESRFDRPCQSRRPERFIMEISLRFLATESGGSTPCQVVSG